MKKQIEVFLRQCYNSRLQLLPDRERPFWFDKIKVFENFKNTLDPDLVNYTIIYDEFYGNIDKTFLSQEKNVEIIKCGSECDSFLETINIIRSKNFDDNQIIYFLEDDYLHLPGWCDIMIEGFSLNSSYLTLYSSDLSDNSKIFYKIFTTKNSYWRTLPVTSNTFACKYRTLLEDLEIHQRYSSSNAIKKEDGFHFSRDFDKFWYLQKNKKYIVSPIPGWSTHCDKNYLSPIIDWESVINQNLPKKQYKKNNLIYN